MIQKVQVLLAMRELAFCKGNLLDMTDDTNRSVVMHLQKGSLMRQNMEEMGIFDAQALQRHGFNQDARHILNSMQVAEFFKSVRLCMHQQSSPLSEKPSSVM